MCCDDPLRSHPQANRSSHPKSDPLPRPIYFTASPPDERLVRIGWIEGESGGLVAGLGAPNPFCLVPAGGAQPVCPMTGGEGRTCKSNPPGVASDIVIRGTKVENMPPWARFDQAL